MSSEYYNNPTSTLKSPAATTMHVNPSPYKSLLSEQQQQQRLYAPQPTSQPPPTIISNSTSSQLQDVFNNNQQQNSWSAQQPGYTRSSKIMQAMPPPSAPQAAQAAQDTNWQHQQLQAQQSFQNNLYQQNTMQQQQLQQQQWPQNPQKISTTSTYDNYHQQPANNSIYKQQSAAQQQQQQQQQQHQPQEVAQQNSLALFQRQQQVAQRQPLLPATNVVNFFDNSNNNSSQSVGADGWGDWDWNDNSVITQPVASKSPAQTLQSTSHQQSNCNDSSIIADSFCSQNSDTWNWGTNTEGQDVATTNAKEQPKMAYDKWNWNSTDSEKRHQQQDQQQQIPPPIQSSNEQRNDNWNWQTGSGNQQYIATMHQHVDDPKNNIVTDTAKPNQLVSPPPPCVPSEFSSPSLENRNYNTAITTAANNIPSTQAKPVTFPSRQRDGNVHHPSDDALVTENPIETTLMPPQGFQNVEEPTAPMPTATVSPPMVPSTASTPPMSNIPPPASHSSATSGNPFKRSGVVKHHRAVGLLDSTTSAGAVVPPAPSVFNMPPPPPVDFANTGSVTLIEPDNNELLSQENQEVLSLATPKSITLSNATSIQSPSQPPTGISLPNVFPSTQHHQPPPNDERNQYLQTSHLSENSEEQQPEADGLLPPPGLSRLVLGEPELEASQQRLVMGTEAPVLDLAATQAAVMHLEERHADGEDTASENAAPVLSLAGQGGPPTSSTLSSDRNLYLVPGESNTTNSNQQQRVVTGVELAGQREIEMDGENLEDEQMQQQCQHHHHQQQQLQQQQQQQQHHQHQQQQHHHHHQQQNLSPEARNEPPVEGAADNVTATTSIASNANHPADQHHIEQHRNSNQVAKTKDLNTNSSPNDDDDSDDRLLNDRAMNLSTAGSSKSRSKYENDRVAASSRRRDKRASIDRYESDEYLNSEGDYSSEREERERRERDRRRNYREGSVRSERGADDNDENHSRRHRVANKRDKYYYEEEDRKRSGREDRDRERVGERLKGEKRSQRHRGYDADSRYETEESTRFDSRKDPSRRSTRHGDRSDQGGDYDDYNRRGGYRSTKRANDNYDFDRRDRRRSDKHREPRYKDDPRYDPREYDEYRKHSSRNARDSDIEKEGGGLSSRSGRMHHDPRHVAAAAAMYGYPSGGYYDPYTAYYYQQMARTNPQAYAEWYKKYYGHAAAGVIQPVGLPVASNAANLDSTLPSTGGNDGRESVHSGRSSAHNDIKDRSGAGAGALSMRESDAIANEPQRLTPCKFINEHTVVSFGSGILVTVKPKYTPNGSISNIVKLLKFKPNDETRKLFKVFPGPLVRGLTHKKTIIEFCHEQIRLGPMDTTIYAKQLITNNSDRYRGSYTLMWNLLILLLKQNGMVVGTDIAELLLKNQQQFPYQILSSSSNNNSLKSKSGSTSPVEVLDIQKDVGIEENCNTKSVNQEEERSSQVAKEKLPEEEQSKDHDTEENSSSDCLSLTEEEITERFRNYLLYGNVNEALEWATDNNLWGHALFLASKLDRRSHANVMMKFANKLSLNDPLQTLYQLMSGRTPSSVTCVSDEKWGDWRPHLSMILSNTSQKPELDRKAITTLGDSLFNRGDLYAAHFCYLMAQVGFGRYQETATQETSLQQHLPKLVLLGTSHYKKFQDFAQNEAIIMTEIYEYACSLNDDKFSIVEFQPYKFLLASRLLDYGFHLKSLMYLEQIAVHIARDPTKYESSFIYKVYEMADRLKYYDPVLEKTIDDQQQGSEDNGDQNLFSSQQVEEQKWLQNLRQLSQQYKHDYATTAAAAAATTTTTTAIHDTQQTQLHGLNYNYQQQQIDQQFMEINKQFSELNLQYQQNTPDQEPGQPMFYNTEQQQKPTGEQALQTLDPYSQQQQEQQQQQQILQTEQSGNNAQNLSQQIDAVPTFAQQQYPQPDMAQQQAGYTQNYYNPLQQPTQYNTVEGLSLDNQQSAATAPYDYWGQQQQPYMPQLTEENARPTISMPKSKTYDNDEEDSTTNKQQLSNEVKKQQQQAQHQKVAKKDDKDSSKGNQPGNTNSGWFGGIWNKFSLKPKNQMILPDDKNPSIVWDPEKKKWVNTDGDEDEQEAFKPPPKITDLISQSQMMSAQQQPHMPVKQQQQHVNPMPFMNSQEQQHQHHHHQQQQQQQQQYASNSMSSSVPSENPMQQPQSQSQPQVPGPAKTPTLQSNMFKMQRNRTLKNAYVDVFNPSGAPMNKAAENILAPAVPPAALPQGGYFIPGSQPSTIGGSQEQLYQQQQQQQQQHHDYNLHAN